MVAEVNGKQDLVLAVPGGFAGQLFAVAYGAWVFRELGSTTHIRFHDVGTSIAKFGLGNILETPRAQSLGISYSRVFGNWPPASGAVSSVGRHLLSSRFLAPARVPLRIARGGLKGAQLAFRNRPVARADPIRQLNPRVISESRLRSAKRGGVVVGFPTSYQIVEEAWDLLTEMIRQAEMPDFSANCGLEESISIHWRLGDYVNSDLHGTVGWPSLETCLSNIDRPELPIKIFSDSIDLAREAVGSRLKNHPHEFISNEIATDLREMTRSRIFIGTHSGISVLAAMALRHDNETSRTWFPNRWFVTSESERQFFVPARETFGGSSFYSADLGQT